MNGNKVEDLTLLTLCYHKKIEFVYSIGTLTFTHFRDICWYVNKIVKGNQRRPLRVISVWGFLPSFILHCECIHWTIYSTLGCYDKVSNFKCTYILQLQSWSWTASFELSLRAFADSHYSCYSYGEWYSFLESNSDRLRVLSQLKNHLPVALYILSLMYAVCSL